MAGCSFERTIRSPLKRISAFSRLFSAVRGYNHPIPATGPRFLTCNKVHGGQPHGYLTSLTGGATMIHINSLIRSINVPCSYSVLRHCRKHIHSTSSESLIFVDNFPNYVVTFIDSVPSSNFCLDLQHGEYEWQDPKSPDEV